MSESLDSERMPLTSEDVLRNRIDALRELIPEAFTEENVDMAGLRQALGDFVDEAPERYGLLWPASDSALAAMLRLATEATKRPTQDQYRAGDKIPRHQVPNGMTR